MKPQRAYRSYMVAERIWQHDLHLIFGIWEANVIVIRLIELFLQLSFRFFISWLLRFFIDLL